MTAVLMIVVIGSVVLALDVTVGALAAWMHSRWRAMR